MTVSAAARPICSRESLAYSSNVATAGSSFRRCCLRASPDERGGAEPPRSVPLRVCRPALVDLYGCENVVEGVFGSGSGVDSVDVAYTRC